MGRCYEAFEKKQKLDINKENLHLTSHLTSEKYEHLNTSDKVSRCKKITTQMLKILFSMVWASVYSSSLVHWSLASFISTACPQILPAWIQLSKDRWKVFYINKDGLSSQEKCLWESRSSRKWSHHCRRFPLCWNVMFIEIVKYMMWTKR